jgi:hypothetical protein
VAAINTSTFATDSQGKQVLISLDGKRILILTTVYDSDAQQVVGSVCGLLSTGGTLDTTFGNAGTVGMTAAGYQGCVGVRMSQHPVTGEILVLLRMQTAQQQINKIQSLFVKLTADGKVATDFTGVYIDSDSNPAHTNVWIATDISWSVRDKTDRSKDKIVIVGTVVSQLGDETSKPFVRQYLATGQLDLSFGAPLSTVAGYVTSSIDNGGNNGSNNNGAPLQVVDLTNSEIATGTSTGIAPTAATKAMAADVTSDISSGPTMGKLSTFFSALNAADNKAQELILSAAATPVAASTSASVLQTVATAPTSHAASTGLSGLMILSVQNAAVGMAQRVIVYDRYVEVLGTAYDDVQGTFAISFICQIDMITQQQTLLQLQLSDLYQTTVAQNFVIDFTTGTRCIVGYGLRNAAQVDSADAFLIKIDGNGKISQKSRLTLGGEYFQSLTAVAIDPTNRRFVTTGLVQTGRTIYTRLGCILTGPSL